MNFTILFHDIIESLRSRTAYLDLPLLPIRGGMSELLTGAGVEDFRKLCPHMKFTNASDASHMIEGDHNDAFIEAILEFLFNSETGLTGPRIGTDADYS